MVEVRTFHSISCYASIHILLLVLGHFERRISFGYDADLVQVRAEFDGTMLRIVVPRRISPVTLLHGRT